MKKILLMLLITAISFSLTASDSVATFEEFGKPETILFANGYMYILEGTTIYIYNEKDYSFVKKFGKDGEGPGEIKRSQFAGPIIITPHKGKLYISNSARLSVFSATGEFIKETKITPFDIYVPYEDKYVLLSNAEMDGNPQKRVLAVFLADEKLQKGKLLYKSDMQVGMNASFSLPIAPFQAIPMGDRLFVAAGKEGFVINEHDINGKLVNKIKKDTKKETIPSDYKDKTHNWFKTSATFKTVYPFIKDRINIKEKFPHFFFFLPLDNKLYIFTNKMKGENRECIITDTKGKELKRVYLPLPHVYGYDYKYPYNIHKGAFYKLVENVDDENWELIKIKL